jgi:hypothetical protein
MSMVRARAALDLGPTGQRAALAAAGLTIGSATALAAFFAASAWSEAASRRASMLGITGGAGLIASAVGIATGGTESPVAAIGFVAALVAATGFYALLGRRSARVR